MKRIINDLITNKNKNIGPITNSDDLIIINLPKNPKKGGSPPRDRRKKNFFDLIEMTRTQHLCGNTFNRR